MGIRSGYGATAREETIDYFETYGADEEEDTSAEDSSYTPQAFGEGMTDDTSGDFNPGYYIDAASGSIYGTTGGTTSGIPDGSDYSQDTIGDALPGVSSGPPRPKAGGGGGGSAPIPTGVPPVVNVKPPAPAPSAPGGLSTGAKVGLFALGLGGVAAAAIVIRRRKKGG